MQVNGNAEDSILWLAQEREFGDMDTLRVDCYLEEAMFNLLAKLEVDTG
ncbi:hypothetical protein [Halorubrum halophilum]|nr:hypothetical protein [Halorubrum halophilum]